MCGRFVQLNSTIMRTQAVLNFITNIDTYHPQARSLESFNVAPSKQVVAIYLEESAPILGEMAWGYKPSWAKSAQQALINARAETVLEKPTFKPIVGNRAIIPVEGFYEWKQISNGTRTKHPYFFERSDSQVMLLAALYSKTVDTSTGEISRNFLILTQAANQMMNHYHDRMPVILEPNQTQHWLTCPSAREATLNATAERPDDLLTARRVPNLVNSYKNDGPELIANLRQESNPLGLI